MHITFSKYIITIKKAITKCSTPTTIFINSVRNYFHEMSVNLLHKKYTGSKIVS